MHIEIDRTHGNCGGEIKKVAGTEEELGTDKILKGQDSNIPDPKGLSAISPFTASPCLLEVGQIKRLTRPQIRQCFGKWAEKNIWSLTVGVVN